MNKPAGKTFLFFLSLLFVLALLPSFARGGQANIFVYHRFGDNRFPSTNVALDDFEAHLKILQNGKVEVLPLGEVVERLRQGKPLPAACAVLTVDDGYRSFLTGAMPLLRRFGYPATLFVSTGSVGRGGYLSWDELKSLSREGIEIGSHSASHMYLVERISGETTSQWLERVRSDLLAAQDIFRKELGRSPRLFSYPYGEYSPEIVNLVESLGFSGAAGQHSGVVSGAGELFALPRFPMGGPFATSRKLFIQTENEGVAGQSGFTPEPSGGGGKSSSSSGDDRG